MADSNKAVPSGPAVKTSAKDQLYMLVAAIFGLLFIVIVLYVFGGKIVQSHIGTLLKNSFTFPRLH